MNSDYKVGEFVELTDLEGNDKRNLLSLGVGYKITDVGNYDEKPCVYIDTPKGVNHYPLYLYQIKRMGVATKEEAKIPEVNYILQYELDTDPFETFETMAQVEARIKELALNHRLKRESMKVYEVRSVLNVKLDTKVSFTSPESVPQPKVKKSKGGRPATLTPEQRKKKQRLYAKRYYKKQQAKKLAGTPVAITKVAPETN